MEWTGGGEADLWYKWDRCIIYHDEFMKKFLILTGVLAVIVALVLILIV
jgi:hypothetical protein